MNTNFKELSIDELINDIINDYESKKKVKLSTIEELYLYCEHNDIEIISSCSYELIIEVLDKENFIDLLKRKNISFEMFSDCLEIYDEVSEFFCTVYFEKGEQSKDSVLWDEYIEQMIIHSYSF